ncbi:MAG: DMT family transporter [Deltaproteobacteria bacterium]|nr:DMT family transporter [Deltaproteobacteria bacterium]
MRSPHYLLLAVALLAMTTSGPAIRFAAAPAIAIVLWRVILGWPVLALLALWRRERWPLAPGLAAGFFLAVHWIAWSMAVQRTTLATASLLICTGSLWTALLSRPLLGEPVTRRQWTGLALALLGVSLVVSSRGSGRHSLLGDLYALGGALAWVGYTFVGRRARQRSGFFGYTATVYLCAGLFAAIPALALRLPLAGYDRRTWLALGALALLPTLLGHGTVNYLLKHVGPAQLSLWTLADPVISTFSAWPLFGERPPPQVLVGAAFTLGGVALGISERGKVR